MANAAVITMAIAAALLLCLHHWVNMRQPQPYMDELFHVPQAQKFCAALMQRTLPTYHRSITTPPAIYLLSALVSFLLPGLSSDCSPRFLRALSAVLALLTLPLVAQISLLLRHRISGHAREVRTAGKQGSDSRKEAEDKLWLTAFIIWLHPVFLFYANLFYTDIPAMFWLLVAWYFSLRQRVPLSAICGFFATLNRQTNMVWHGFIVLDDVMFDVHSHVRFAGSVIEFCVAAVHRIVSRMWSHIIVGVIYLAYLVWNGGVALGDKSHHDASLHYAMLPYFLGFHAASFLFFEASNPSHFLRTLSRLRGKQTAVFFSAACITLASLVIATGDTVHPFILADNRHFTFYTYRRWFLRSALHRLSLIPIYAWPILSIWHEFLSVRHDVKTQRACSDSERMSSEHRWIAEFISDCLLLFCACLVLIPASLMEPRYFVTGNMLLTMKRLSRQKETKALHVLVLVSIVFILMNIGLVYIFAEMPFTRPVDAHSPTDTSPGRFMF